MATKKTHRKIMIIGGIVSVIMFGFCFAMVPLYSLICKQLGISSSATAGGFMTTAVSAETKELPDLSRTITVQFVATNHHGMPWEFYPRVKSVQVHPGENKQVNFFAKNPTDRNMSAQAIPSMTPTTALKHFHKIECFCFNQQQLKAKESKEMPMIFRIDKDIPKEVQVVTLAYTLFDTSPKENQPKDRKAA